jgi:hypothetical protein
MNSSPMTPGEFRELKTIKERNEAYSLLWDAWQTKGEKKEVLYQKVKKTKRQRKRGADKTNELATNASNFLIEEYWNSKHSDGKLTAKLLLKKLHQKPTKEFKHLTQKVVERWYTAIKKAWGKSSWARDEDAYSEFFDKAKENYQVLIKRKPKSPTMVNS